MLSCCIVSDSWVSSVSHSSATLTFSHLSSPHPSHSPYFILHLSINLSTHSPHTFFLSMSVCLSISLFISPLLSFSFHPLRSHCVGVPVNSRVSSKIQQLLNTLKRPKRPPLREFFVDDFEELLDGKLGLKVITSLLLNQ